MRVGLGTTTHCPFLVQFNTKQGEQKDSAPETVSSVNRHISWYNGPHRVALCTLPGKFARDLFDEVVFKAWRD